MKKVTHYTFLVGGMFFLSISAQAAYKASYVSTMPRDAVNFISAYNNATQQLNYVGERNPVDELGRRRFREYYNNNFMKFNAILTQNLDALERAGQVLSEATRMGEPYKAVSECLRPNDDWKDLRNALMSISVIRDYQATTVQKMTNPMSGPNMTGYAMAGHLVDQDEEVLDSSVRNAFSRMGAALDFRKMDGSIWTSLDQCCEESKVPRNGRNLCNEKYVHEKLSMLSDIEKLPSAFVNPMYAGHLAPSLTERDMLDLASLGQMQDFIQATDFNSQSLALMNLETRCQQSRQQAFEELNKKGERRSIFQTGWQALQCGAATLARNGSKAVKQIALAHVKARYVIYGKEMSCPPEVQDAATRQLVYSYDDFRADFEHLVTLPPNIIRSRPVAKPLEVTNNGDDLVIELRDEAGYTQDTLFISGEINPQFAQMQMAGTQPSQLQVVNNGTAGPTNTVRATGRGLVNGIGSTRGNGERVLVRELAYKTGQGDLEAARTLAGSVKNRTGELERKVAKASTDKALIKEKKEKRATEARGLVTKATVLESVVETSKAFNKNYDKLYRALGLADDTAVSGRVVERPGSGGNTNSSGSGTTVTSGLPNYADQAASQSYKQEQLRKGIALVKETVVKMSDSIVALSAKLNQIITQKEELAAKLPMMAGEKEHKKIDDGDYDNRGERIYNTQQPLVRTRLEINTLNAQEMGLRAAISLAKSSFKSYVQGAATFQGLMVTSTTSRVPASTNPMQQNPLQAPLQVPQMNATPGGSNVPPGMMPPAFNPTATQPQQGMGFFKVFELFAIPMAHAKALSFEQKRQHVLKEFMAFMQSYADYSERMEAEVIGVRQQAWERFIANEREMRDEPLLGAEARVIMYSYTDALDEEVPELVKLKNTGKFSSGTDRQLFQYIEQIRSDSAKLTDLLQKESQLSAEVQSPNPLHDDISWTGMLPAIALQ